MIDLKVLDGMKLVREQNIATVQEAEQVIERAITQGSQDWGVRREDGAVLRLALELRKAQALASSADDSFNKLKGLQLENGRLKKRIAVLEGLEVVAKRALDSTS